MTDKPDRVKAEDADDAPTPECRAREGAGGIPVTLSDGREWLIPHAPTAKALDDQRDAMFDEATLRNSVSLRDVRIAAWRLLMSNYRLDPGEAAALIGGEDPEADKALTEAVVESLIGQDDRKRPRGYSEWVRSALYANGLDPTRIPDDAVHDVIEHLRQTNRVAPPEKFIASARYKAKRAGLRAQAEW